MATLDTHAIARTLTDANRPPPRTATMPPARIRVNTREEFDEAFEELFETGRPIEAPSVEALEEWGVDLEDDTGRRIPAAAGESRADDAAALQPADPVLFAVVSTALGGASCAGRRCER